jgi:hypothetical protein
LCIKVCLKVNYGVNNGHDSPYCPQMDAGAKFEVNVDEAEDGTEDFKHILIGDVCK